ncbi:DNA repair protein RadC [Castellaniella defragrans 65Phen]|uniref:DNA repair protein RadC n=1 Tax=Castellaniella defragrans (strain DSM 12143 / CCUG 39792 / 65Phen) TaxID=1437824 RepID=W8WZK8_CASD6|nr:hypothetical protein [Castellaniella defragrans]CDM25188.1 DNA repair protein RadC [Castellaniella defragrans 65Phen]
MKEISTAALGYDNMNDVHTLYVRSPSGRYRLASDDQVNHPGFCGSSEL